jgi:hypothetical protein
MLGHQQFRAFFDGVRSAWRGALQQNEEPEHLSLLIELQLAGGYLAEE